MAVTESILDTIKQLLGISVDDTNFDVDVITDINTELADLYQLGIGPPEGFTINDSTSKWSDFLGTDKRLEFVKSYIHLNVKLSFDPPQSSSIIEAIERKIKKLEFRISIAPEITAPASEEG